MDWTPEASRRARAVPIYAALQSLGRSGLADLVERCCACAARLAGAMRQVPGVSVLNDVVLNQVLLRFADDSGRNVTPRVIARVQQEGVLWAGGTEWAGGPAMRVSVSGWRTRAADVDRSAAALEAALRAVVDGS